MKLHRNQAGFSVFTFILLVAVLGAISAVALRVLDNHSAAVKASTSVASQTPKSVTQVSTAPVINKAADLNKALDTLNENDPSAANQPDSNQLNGQLANLN